MPPCPCQSIAGTLSTGVFSPCCVTSHTGPTFSVTSMRPSGRNAMRQGSLKFAISVIVNGRVVAFSAPALICAYAAADASVSSTAASRSFFMNPILSLRCLDHQVAEGLLDVPVHVRRVRRNDRHVASADAVRFTAFNQGRRAAHDHDDAGPILM